MFLRNVVKMVLRRRRNGLRSLSPGTPPVPRHDLQRRGPEAASRWNTTDIPVGTVYDSETSINQSPAAAVNVWGNYALNEAGVPARQQVHLVEHPVSAEEMIRLLEIQKEDQRKRIKSMKEEILKMNRRSGWECLWRVLVVSSTREPLSSAWIATGSLTNPELSRQFTGIVVVGIKVLGDLLLILIAE